MKKVFMMALLALSFNANAVNVSAEEFVKLLQSCLDERNQTACQTLIDNSLLSSVKECDRHTCNNIGWIYDYVKQPKQAVLYYQKSCEKFSNPNACSNLGNSYYMGSGVKQDVLKASRYLKTACDANHPAACRNLGALYYEGKGVGRSFANARKYHEKACGLNKAASCFYTGVLYYNGQGVRQNKTIAKEYAGKACDLGNQDGCDFYRELNEQGVR